MKHFVRGSQGCCLVWERYWKMAGGSKPARDTTLPINVTVPNPVLLSDEQVRRFITDGYLQLDCGLPAEVHEAIYDKLQWILHEEGNPGNNILPAVPEMQQVLDSPVIRGALASILGPDYVLHPHRFVHNIEPAERTEEELRIG